MNKAKTKHYLELAGIAFVSATWLLVTIGLMCVCGCSGMETNDRNSSMSVYALGIPGIAIIKSSNQVSDNRGDEDHTAAQANPVTTPISLTK